MAVAAEIKKLNPDAQISFVRQVGDKKTRELLEAQGSGVIDKTFVIAAGKFRRYNGVVWWKQMLDVPMQLRNIRDALYFVTGIIQSLFLVIFQRPDVVFVKGGYVGFPVGLAAAALGKPLVIHESDTRMGLTNKMLSKRAAAIGLGVPTKYFQIDSEKARFVGVPISKHFTKVDKNLQAEYKKQLQGIDPEERLVVITGGSNGAQKINEAMAKIAPNIVEEAIVIHQTGYETYEQTKQSVYSNLDGNQQNRYRLIPFIDKNIHVYFGAADIIVTRVGTTTMSELAVSHKPVILVPNPKLVYGHQLMNAKMYEKAGAAVVLDENELVDNPDVLLDRLIELLHSKKHREQLADNLSTFARPKASEDIAKMIIDNAKR